MMRKKCFQETPESVRMVENLSTEWSVRSALRRDERTSGTDVTVECDAGVVRLLGVVDTARESDAAGALAAMVGGVREVDNQLKAAASAASRFRREG
jgi:osmotically-inducible protein OsmY